MELILTYMCIVVCMHAYMQCIVCEYMFRSKVNVDTFFDHSLSYILRVFLPDQIHHYSQLAYHLFQGFPGHFFAHRDYRCSTVPTRLLNGFLASELWSSYSQTKNYTDTPSHQPSSRIGISSLFQDMKLILFFIQNNQQFLSTLFLGSFFHDNLKCLSFHFTNCGNFHLFYVCKQTVCFVQNYRTFHENML